MMRISWAGLADGLPAVSEPDATGPRNKLDFVEFDKAEVSTGTLRKWLLFFFALTLGPRSNSEH
jgi:hypothetical protein